MGFNEIVLILTALLCAGFVVFVWRLDKNRLYGAITIFLILISIFGVKIVSFFGFQTNTGNIFYASVFLATYFLIERYGKKEGKRSIIFGVGATFFFLIFAKLVVVLNGTNSTDELNSAFSLVFSETPRLAFASLFAYVLSQSLNVYLYIWLKEKFNYRYLWLRANISNALSQVVDSIVFFTIAFYGTLAPASINEILIVGYVIKVVYMMIASNLLYLNRIEEDEDGSFSIVKIF